MDKKREILIGTRGSQLAIWQANWVKSLIIKEYPQMMVELVVIKTKGDKILDLPLNKIGGKGLFIKEIEAALFEKKIDIRFLSYPWRSHLVDAANPDVADTFHNCPALGCSCGMSILSICHHVHLC